MMKDEFFSSLQGNAHRGVSPKSDDSTAQFASQIFIVVFGGDVRRTEGVLSPSLPRPFGFFISIFKFLPKVLDFTIKKCYTLFG